MNRRALLMTTASPLPIWASVPIPPFAAWLMENPR